MTCAFNGMLDQLAPSCDYGKSDVAINQLNLMTATRIVILLTRMLERNQQQPPPENYWLDDDVEMLDLSESEVSDSEDTEVYTELSDTVDCSTDDDGVIFEKRKKSVTFANVSCPCFYDCHTLIYYTGESVGSVM